MRIAILMLGLFFVLAGLDSLNAAEPGPNTHPDARYIQAGIAQVDAVTGKLTVDLPVGPRLPGRIPLGFTWHYDGSADFTSQGQFRAFAWPTYPSFAWSPSGPALPSRVHVTLNHQRVTFLPAAVATATAKAWLQERHADGSAEEDVAGLTQSIDRVMISEDGRMFLVASRWSNGAEVPVTRTGYDPVGGGWTSLADQPIVPFQIGPGHVNKAQRAVLINGDLATWMVLGGTLIEAQSSGRWGTVHLRNRWGDAVDLDQGRDTGNPASTVMTITGRSAGTALGTLTLTCAGSAWTLSNSLGLETVNLTGFRTGVAPEPPGSGEEYPCGFILESVGDRLGRPLTLAYGSSGHLTRTTSPAGLVHEFSLPANDQDYSQSPAKAGFEAGRPASNGTGLQEGDWRGYIAGLNLGAIASHNLGERILGVKRFTVTDQATGTGHLVTLTRTTPTFAGVSGGTAPIAWGGTAYQTEVRRYEGLAESGNHAFTILHHARPQANGGHGWADLPGPGSGSPEGPVHAPSPLVEQMQMVLFCLNAVVLEERGATLGGQRTVTSRTSHDLWSLKSITNPAGTPQAMDGSGQPVPVSILPRATRTVVEHPLADNPTEVTERLDWDGRTYRTERIGTLAPGDPAGRVAGYSGNPDHGACLLRTGDLPTVDAEVLRIQTATSSFLLGPAKLVRSDDQTRIQGPGFQRLRQAPEVDLGAISHTYDAEGRRVRTEGRTAAHVSTVVQTYAPGRPEVESSTRSLVGPDGAVALSGRVGENFTYEGLWRASVRERPDERATVETRDGLGRLVTIQGVDGVTTRYGYDTRGRLARSTREAKDGVAEVSIAWDWDPDGRWLTETTTSGAQTRVRTTRMDGFGRVTSVTTGGQTPAERTVTYGYDGFGRRTLESLPTRKGATPRSTVSAFDPDGFLKSVSNTRGGTTHFSRRVWTSLDGVSGFLSTDTLPNGRTRVKVRDLLDQLIRQKDASERWTHFAFDAYGRMVEARIIASQGDQVRRYAYNDMGWLVEQSQPEEGVSRFSRFTLHGKPLLTVQGDPGGNQTTTTETQLYQEGEADGFEGQVKSVLAWAGQAGLGRAVTRTFKYDGQHRVKEVTEVQGGETVREGYHYDGLGRLLDKTVQDVAGNRSFTVSRELDAFGNTRSLTYPSGKRLGLAYDGEQRLTEVRYGDNEASLALVGRLDHDQVWGASEGEVLTYGNGASTTWRRNPAGDLERVTHAARSAAANNLAPVEDATLAWSLDGLMTDRGLDHFEYDGLGRLREATVSGLNGERIRQRFGYDDYGNRTSVESTALAGALPEEAVTCVLTVGLDNRLPQQSSAGALTGRQYDALGRLQEVWAIPGRSTTLTSWVYDALGRVVGQGGAQAQVQENYLLDAAGLRFKRVKANGTTVYTVYGFNREPLSVFEVASGVAPAAQIAPLSAGSMAAPMALAEGEGRSVSILSPATGVTVGAGSPVTFSGSTTTGGALTWQFGDGSSAGDQASVSHAFAQPGSYTVTLQATYYESACTQQDPETGECLQWGPPMRRTASESIQVVVLATPGISSLGASPASIRSGQPVTLAWSVSGAEGMAIDNGVGDVTGQTSTVVYPTQTTTYTLTASNGAGSSSRTVTVAVDQAKPAIVQFVASPASITRGSSTTLTWSVVNATSLSISNGVGTVTSLAGKVVAPTVTTTYVLTATGPGGTSTQAVTVGVNLAAPVITVFASNKAEITLGQSFTLSWSTSGATSLSLDRGLGSMTGRTSTVVTPTLTGMTAITLTASNGAVSTSRAVVVGVKPGPTLAWRQDLVYGFGQLLLENRGGRKLYQQGDHLGTPSVLTDASGVVVGRQKNLPFGERLPGWGEKSLRRYTNHEDGEQLPIHMQARIHLPSYGRFAQVDPAYDQRSMEAETWNLYSYCGNNPVTRSDPDGTQAVDKQVDLSTGPGGEEKGQAATDPATDPGKEGGNPPARVPDANDPNKNQSPRVATPDSAKADEALSQTEKETNATGFTKLEDAVKGLRDQIVTEKKDIGEREYGAQIYSYEGKYHYGTIQTGTTVKESKDGQATVQLFSKDAVVGIPKGAKLVGGFHTHPGKAAAGLSGEDLQGVASMRYNGTHGKAFNGYRVDSGYQGYVWKAGDSAILNYKYPGKVTEIYNPDNVKYGWVQ